MTGEEFTKILDDKEYHYYLVGDKTVVRYGSNSGHIFLNSLKTLSPGVEFNNEGDVDLRSLKTLPPGVVFNNGEDVNLWSLKTIPPGVHFNNGGDIHLKSLIGGYFRKWNGLIDGIDPNTLLNGMIKRGIFL